MPRFIEVLTLDDPTYIDADKIVSMTLRPELDPPCWVATTLDHRTFKVSEFIGNKILVDSLDDTPPTDLEDAA